MVVTMILSLGIGFLLGWYITGRKSVPVASESEMGEELFTTEEGGELLFPFESEGEKSMAANENMLAVNDQNAGNSVAIAEVVLEVKSWVAVHEDRAGAPGNILGARLFAAGKSSANVELLRATAPGKVYYAMLHRDDGDGKFDHAKDVPMKNAAGQIIVVKFNTAPSIQTQ